MRPLATPIEVAAHLQVPVKTLYSWRYEGRVLAHVVSAAISGTARAVLPIMRAQRSGLVVAISSTAGIVGQEFCTAYAASKFGVEGWIESLTPEVAPFGIRTMLVEPGFFRTELLTPVSTNYAGSSTEDYAERTEQTVPAWKGMNGRQGGDPAKLAEALIHLARQAEPPLRFVAGADAVETVEQKAKNLLAQVDDYRDLSTSLSLDELEPTRSTR
jgi:NAD(P)-dependent dehydrogenase (short-subunit alcohol dehydrogenase family)